MINPKTSPSTRDEQKPESLLAAWRQWRFPKEFRIAPPLLPADFAAVIEQLQQSAALSPTTTDTASKDHLRFLASLGTGLWRLRQKMVESGTDRPLEEMRRAYRHVEAMSDVLTET